MYSYCMGTRLDVISTIDIDYEAHSFESKSYQPRKYNDMITLFDKGQNGLILAKDEQYNTVGFVYTRKLGTLGLCGPMAVLPDHWNSGIATKLLLEAEKLLIEEKCKTIGFETMPYLMNYYLERGWIANGITYFLRYGNEHSEKESLCKDTISIKEINHNQLNELNELSSFVGLRNGVDFTEEIAREIDMKRAIIYGVRVNSNINGVVLLELNDDIINIKMMNFLIDANRDFCCIKRVFDVICQYFDRKELMFSINTQYLELLVSALHYRCKIKGYSIRFQNQRSKVNFCENVFTSYHWGT